MSTPILHSQRDTHAGDPPPASTDSTADALIYLCDRGAHFVLCRPGGQHMYYADDQGRGNHKWTYKTAGGEIRSQRGYLLLHGDSLHHLHAAVKHGHYADYPFPAQQLGLFTPEELGPVVLPDADADPKLEPRRGGESWAQMAKRLETDLYTTLEGSKGVSGRNEALFNALRCWAYSVHVDASVAAWQERVLQVAMLLNGRFPKPLPRTEVLSTAYSVACWTWARQKRHYDHSRAAQRRRIVKRWTGSGSDDAVQHLDRRHASIIADFGDGVSVKALATTTGYHPRHIRKIVKRDRDAARDRRRMAAVAARAGGWSLREIAAELNVSKDTVRRDLQVSGNLPGVS